MADQGSPGQSAPVAAPAPARDRREPGHGLTEAQFWADEGAPAIGGQYGIPNGLIAAAAAAPPGAPDDVGSMFGRLDARRARGLALQLQRTAGNAHLRAVIAASRLAADAIPGARSNDSSRNGRTNGHALQRKAHFELTDPDAPPATEATHE